LELINFRRMVFCGVDWAEDHHDVAIIDAGGALLAKARIDDDATGLAQLLALLAEHGDSCEVPIPVAIETARGLLVACLRATGRRVFAINPLAVARYRERHSVARKKSDAIDTAALANILRTDIDAHRPLPADSELAQAVAVLARAQQDAVWDRTQAHNKLRSQLREYFPAFLQAFADKRDGIMRPEARTILAAAPTPADAARLTRARLAALLKKAGRKRGIQAEADRLRDVFRAERMRQLPLVEQASAVRLLLCYVPWTLPAPTPTNWSGPQPKPSPSTPTRRSYDRRRERNERHVAAQRNLYNRLLGMLYHCLQNGMPYDEAIAFPATSETVPAPAA
jgi:transposase